MNKQGLPKYLLEVIFNKPFFYLIVTTNYFTVLFKPLWREGTVEPISTILIETMLAQELATHKLFTRILQGRAVCLRSYKVKAVPITLTSQIWTLIPQSRTPKNKPKRMLWSKT